MFGHIPHFLAVCPLSRSSYVARTAVVRDVLRTGRGTPRTQICMFTAILLVAASVSEGALRSPTSGSGSVDAGARPGED
ncbi:hypothetical protein BV20DRAFT_960916 [Pilatotrama ljubarskyi]|nr:hypothetical protein BV20DRAFT_960916 [Pilatotrama ljubarskyi]